MVQKFYVTYNQVHKLCQKSADAILKEFHPNLMIAIGGGGYVPARILRYVSICLELRHARM
jgi:hypoxanthine phosphoribosyltransferase